MPLLPYCITEIKPQIEIPSTGVQGMPVEVFEDAGLRCLVSRYGDTLTLANHRLAQPIRETAIEFNRVLQQVFRQIAIIPFRFPTVLANESELSSFVGEHREEYLRVLPRLRDMVQVEIRVAYQRSPQQSGTEKSGLTYMREQQIQLRLLESAITLMRTAGQRWIESWRERQVLGGVRCYALVTRPAMKKFIEEIGAVEISPVVVARVTGPWPPTEFLQEN